MAFPGSVPFEQFLCWCACAAGLAARPRGDVAEASAVVAALRLDGAHAATVRRSRSTFSGGRKIELISASSGVRIPRRQAVQQRSRKPLTRSGSVARASRELACLQPARSQKRASRLRWPMSRPQVSQRRAARTASGSGSGSSCRPCRPGEPRAADWRRVRRVRCRGCTHTSARRLDRWAEAEAGGIASVP